MGAKSERALILRTRLLGDMGDIRGDCTPEPSTSEQSSSAARATAKALIWLHRHRISIVLSAHQLVSVVLLINVVCIQVVAARCGTGEHFNKLSGWLEPRGGAGNEAGID